MALLDRVSTLLRANLNELVEKAEDPERMLKQVVLDMENQLMQVKTQVAIAVADEHLLEKKRSEHNKQAVDWRRKAVLAVQKGHDDMARAALERALSHDDLEAGFTRQSEDQKHEADNLRQAYRKLEQKLNETRANCEMLIAEHRRAKVVGRAVKARQAAGSNQDGAINRMRNKVHVKAAENAAANEVMNPETLEEQFRTLESADRVEVLLNEIKSRQTSHPAH